MIATKTVTFACVHFTVAFGVTWCLTGSAVLGGAIALVEPLVNTLAFYLHEHLWRAFKAPADPSAGAAAPS